MKSYSVMVYLVANFKNQTSSKSVIQSVLDQKQIMSKDLDLVVD